MTLENKYNRGTHGDSSHMLSTVVLSNENQTCRGWEALTSIGEGGCHNDILGEYYLDVETMQWDDYDDGFLHIKINISYCPYCGRKLDDKRRK